MSQSATGKTQSTSKDSLGDRMKNYEDVNRTKLVRRTPVICRLDGKSFSQWTKGLEQPYDGRLMSIMATVTEYLIDNIQGAVLGYSQSDEISILIRDYDNLNTDAWFDNNIQKMVSVGASLATAKFNEGAQKFFYGKQLAFFDARVFNLPKEEVVNYFIWRQQDAVRNSIRGIATHYLGHKECHGLNNSEVQDKLMELNPPINWNDFDTWKKRGFCVNNNGVDTEIPIFTQDRNYIGKYVEKIKE